MDSQQRHFVRVAAATLHGVDGGVFRGGFSDIPLFSVVFWPSYSRMRLTFWELSWDEMEPICFFLTSIYFMARYLFFLNKSTNSSFKSFFDTHFRTGQSGLMNKRNFDIERLRELPRLSGPRLKISYCCRDVCNCDALSDL